jgi:hypothetical protein
MVLYLLLVLVLLVLLLDRLRSYQPLPYIILHIICAIRVFIQM